MSHAATLDLNHGHLPEARPAVEGSLRGGKRSALDEAGMVLPNDRQWVPITLVLLAVMAIVTSAMLVLAVLNMD